MATCRCCGRLIRWAKTPGGRPTPLDFEPAEAGNVVLVEGVAHAYRSPAEIPPEAGERFVSHFATCPQAAAHPKALGPPPAQAELFPEGDHRRGDRM
jgi:hypothetical protein